MSRCLFDFTDPQAVQVWRAIDDRVMGGVSRSVLRCDPAGHAVFEGRVSLERGGGFASVRSLPGERGLAGARACRLEVRSDGRRYKLSLLAGDLLDGVTHQAAFTAEPGDWRIVELPLGTFEARFRGRPVPQAPGLDPARIRQIGLMIAEQQAGAFALHIRRIGLV